MAAESESRRGSIYAAMSRASAEEVTQLLLDPQLSDGARAERLLPLVYEQLRAIAQQRMKRESSGHTLQATALVHEAYLRLVGDRPLAWESRTQFFVAAAEAMRRVLIDAARKRKAFKRGRGARNVGNVLNLATDEKIDEALALDEALLRLEGVDPQAAQVVRLRFYAGLSIEECAQAPGLSPRTVKRDWAYARARLRQELESDEPEQRS